MREEIAGIQVCRHWTYRTPNRGFFLKVLGHFSYYPAARLLTLPRLERADVAIGTSPTFFAAMAARQAARKWDIPFILEIRDLWPDIFSGLGTVRQPWVIRGLQAWARWLYRQADLIVTVTSSFTEHLVAQEVPREKITTITNGADVDFWRPGDRLESRKKIGVSQEAFLVLYCGAHGISHGLESVLKAAERVRTDPKIRFILVGEGADKPRLKRIAAELQLSNVRFDDAVGKERVADYYHAADLALVTLKDTPLFSKFIPSKIFEIMACGLPILGALRGEAAEIVSRSCGGVVVAPQNVSELASQVERLTGSREQLNHMGRAGREFVVEHFSRDRLASLYCAELVRIQGQKS